jgi:hypothetical protein
MSTIALGTAISYQIGKATRHNYIHGNAPNTKAILPPRKVHRGWRSCV